MTTPTELLRQALEALEAMQMEAKSRWCGLKIADDAIDNITAFLAAPAPAVPPGWKLVPVEPTPEMVKALLEAMTIWVKEIGADQDIYRAVLAAAPSAPPPVALSDEQRNAYDLIDRYLRNNLDDSDYAEYSDALEALAAFPLALGEDKIGDMVIEHLGPAALTGGKMSVYDAFLLGIAAAEAAHGIKQGGQQT